MKKVIFLLAVLLMFQSVSEARDYAKLQAKEIRHAQKYGTTNKILSTYAPNVNNSVANIKDPKLIKIGDYKEVTKAKYDAKAAKDDANYEKIAKGFSVSRVDNYHRQAYSEDFYRLYRICEKLIRANNLEFIDWRFTVQSNQNFNAFNSNMNNVTINTGLYDTFIGNDDAMAFIIGHEMGHALLGHGARTQRLRKKIDRAYTMRAGLAYIVSTKKYLIESKNMEYAADVEGAKIAARAGYDMAKAREAITFMDTLDDGSMERHNTHPNAEHRLKNYDENIKFFPINEWVKQGKYNTYNSEVLEVQRSSDRKSIVIKRGTTKDSSSYYRPETVADLYKRYGYMSYLNGEFKDSVNYFKKVLNEDKSDYAVYLYISYAYEYLGDRESAKVFAQYAKNLAPDNKYVKEQVENL